ncbi:MAG: hypothetical protein OXG81_13740 [Acidobacteria bacterium]|nr:hypothetical protein [Acidobacteriota bacterium]
MGKRCRSTDFPSPPAESLTRPAAGPCSQEGETTRYDGATAPKRGGV